MVECKKKGVMYVLQKKEAFLSRLVTLSLMQSSHPSSSCGLFAVQRPDKDHHLSYGVHTVLLAWLLRVCNAFKWFLLLGCCSSRRANEIKRLRERATSEIHVKDIANAEIDPLV